MKLYVQTFGCRANHYDTEAVLEMARRGGYELTSDASDADVAVVNSCAVTSEAERDARKAIRGLARTSPRLRTVVMGCSSALVDSARTLKTLPTVDHVIAGADMTAMAAALGVPETVGTRRQLTARAVLRVQDGCDEHCTFCATTLARGANRSRPADELVAEAWALAERHPEIVITGIHIGTYGADTGSSLGALMERLVRDVPEVRFRLSSVEATEVDDALADLMVFAPRRLAPHLHAPLQSGSDRLLKRMGRHWYTADSYSRAVERLASRLPVFGLGADVIVGFPGETDADFSATLAVIDRLPFTYLHVFSYSDRAGTAALRLPDRVSGDVARDRSRQLRRFSDARTRSHSISRTGSSADVVLSGPRHGLTEDYLTLSVNKNTSGSLRFSTQLLMHGDTLSVEAS